MYLRKKIEGGRNILGLFAFSLSFLPKTKELLVISADTIDSPVVLLFACTFLWAFGGSVTTTIPGKQNRSKCELRKIAKSFEMTLSDLSLTLIVIMPQNLKLPTS